MSQISGANPAPSSGRRAAGGGSHDPSPAPIDFGWWTAHDGRRHLLSWHPNGNLCLGEDVVCFIAREADVRRRLDGWEYRCDQRDSMTWLAAKLGGRG